MARKKPYAGTDLAAFMTHRIGELRPYKSQGDIASEAGFVNSNMLSMLKNGTTKLALDRVADLARALETDPARLFQMALMQSGHETTRPLIEEIFGSPRWRNPKPFPGTEHKVGCRTKCAAFELGSPRSDRRRAGMAAGPDAVCATVQMHLTV